MNVVEVTDPAHCGCDGPATGTLLSVDTALQLGFDLARPVAETEELGLGASVGRVLAKPLRAPSPLPAFDNSGMDGYAVRRADLVGDGPWHLPVATRIAAGDPGQVKMAPESAVRIFTGAPVPPGCDAVIRQEDVLRSGDQIEISMRPGLSENIRRRGEDLAQGRVVLPGGVIIGPREAAALASCGMGSVLVVRRLRIAILTTGSELRDPGEVLAPGQIWNANRYQLLAALAAPWIELTDLGSVPDNPRRLAEVLREAARTADLIVSTGGVSVGDEDHVVNALREVGQEMIPLKIAMKPGKPLALARIGDAIAVGLPGNPVSAFVSWMVIGARIAEKVSGQQASRNSRRLVHAGFSEKRKPGRCEFRPARLMGRDGSGMEIVEAPHLSFSARVALLAASDGLLLIPAEADTIAEGDLLEFLQF
ncbi:MAG: molybdopterin molybdotransferase MoeA [Paracoccaceae bacterium]|nr:molybdopterin molybdotransferase MoeA [Paracoccaceae bacterium]